MAPDDRVDAAEPKAARSAVCRQQSVERIAGPGQIESSRGNPVERHVVDQEAFVASQVLEQLRMSNLEPAHFAEERDLQERDWRERLGSIAVEPTVFAKPLRAEDHPEKKMGVEQRGHRLRRRARRSGRPGPAHVQLHESASSRSGTRRTPA